MGGKENPTTRGRVHLTVLYGGTFDPIHRGHVAIAEAARDCFQTDVHLLPSADPPHRPPTSATAEQRAEMVDLALAGIDGLYCDRRELHREGKSYSILTLRQMRNALGPDAPLAWLIGADAFRGLADWHGWPELFKLCHFIVADRPQQSLDVLPEPLQSACAGRWAEHAETLSAAPYGRLFRLMMPLRYETSTAIRSDLALAKNMNAALAAPVLAYIQRHQLYRAAV